MFTSQLYPGELIIDDSYNVIPSAEHGRGRIPRDYAAFPTGFSSNSLTDVPMIEESLWAGIIQEQEAKNSRLSDHMTKANIESLDQGQTNYCWANGPVTAMQAVLAFQGNPYIKLSAASVAAPIKGYRNQGGWGTEAVEYMVEHGVMSEEFWPRNYWSNSKYMTEEGKANAQKHKVLEWYDCASRNFDQLMSCVLQNIPVAVGYNWWSHEVCACDGVKIGNDWGIRIRNSWGRSYGANGFAVLTRSKATPDDAVGIRSVRSSFV